MSSGRYLDAVVTAKEHILAGDIFQVVLAQRYDIELEADPFDVYRVLRQVNPSPYMYSFDTMRQRLLVRLPNQWCSCGVITL